MTDHGSARTRSLLDTIAEDTERLQTAITSRTTTATSADGWITVEVSADGTVHNCRIANADEHTNQLVAELLELIGQARTTAQQTIRAELEAVADNDDVRAIRDATRDALARTTTTPPPLTPSDDSWDDDYEYLGKSRIAAD
ncbi:YbaB/EbfC family nucleoid-associated protein [Nocardia sp. SYP-A9097]|uniref:YbaB/EbfC family nucleoid-associated protein n=1 Tax=Nocardia sp. SYP-A9097 TaxID=2663237 RepID=UPI001891C08D|nr:YbaB/EbfC family nucleoid-associated protein [Nocardia sp. SYP-A9097]